MLAFFASLACVWLNIRGLGALLTCSSSTIASVRFVFFSSHGPMVRAVWLSVSLSHGKPMPAWALGFYCSTISIVTDDWWLSGGGSKTFCETHIRAREMGGKRGVKGSSMRTCIAAGPANSIAVVAKQPEEWLIPAPVTAAARVPPEVIPGRQPATSLRSSPRYL